MKQSKNKSNSKRIIAWLILIILIILLLILNYVKFFGAPNNNIEEYPADSSSEQAIQTALQDIVMNFNNSEELNALSNQNIKMKAILNQHSIFISYITDTTTTYEFSYNNLNLSITIDKDEKNLEKFNQVYSILLKAIQKRINNTQDNIDDIITQIVNKTETYDGIIIEENEKTYFYQINITKKLVENTEENNKETSDENNLETNNETKQELNDEVNNNEIQ